MASSKKKTKTVVRNAITGRFTKKERAKTHPRTTATQTVSIKRKRC